MMVSTRGVKFKFTEGEKVLCYEPDLTKAKVLYDSKVLEVNDNKKDHRGRKSIQYLIHFQGWNSSWDRYVCEDFVLKDVEENRQLQRDLAEKAQLQLGAYLYRRERTKRRRITAADGSALEAGEASSCDEAGSGSGPPDSGDEAHRTPTPGAQLPADPVDAALDDDDKVPLQLSDAMKRLLELDHDLIKNQGKLVVLPTQPNVATILEGYVKQYARAQLCGGPGHDLDEARRLLNICKEMADGLRIYFDFTLRGLLLYNPECAQFEARRQVPARNHADQAVKVEPPVEQVEFPNGFQMVIKQEVEDDAEENGQAAESNFHTFEPQTDEPGCSRKRRLRSYRSDLSQQLNTTKDSVPHNGHSKPTSALRPAGGVDDDPEDNYPLAALKHEAAATAAAAAAVSNSTVASSSSRCSSPSGQRAGTRTRGSPPQSQALLGQVLSWRLVPDSMYDETPAKPSLLYGAIHLARLFVKLPKLLYETNMPEKKLKVLLHELDIFLNYLEEHTEWFGEAYYSENIVGSETA